MGRASPRQGIDCTCHRRGCRDWSRGRLLGRASRKSFAQLPNTPAPVYLKICAEINTLAPVQQNLICKYMCWNQEKLPDRFLDQGVAIYLGPGEWRWLQLIKKNLLFSLISFNNWPSLTTISSGLAIPNGGYLGPDAVRSGPPPSLGILSRA